MDDAEQTIARTLRSARQAAGLSLEEVAAELKIRLKHLEAIEAGDFEDLPPPAFTAGFVRSYATLLGLDGCLLARQVREQMGIASATAELRFPEPVPESRLPGRAAMLSGLFGLVAIYFGWIHDFSAAPGQALQSVEAVPERLAGLVDESEIARQDASLRSAGFRVAADGTRAQENRRVSPMDGAGEKAPANGAEIDEAMRQPASTVSQAEVTAANAGATGRIRLTAKQDSWIRVVDGDGRERFSGVLRAGESWAPKGEGSSRLKFTTSNAGGLSLVVDGEILAALGETGSFVADIALEADRLKNDYTLAMH